MDLDRLAGAFLSRYGAILSECVCLNPRSLCNASLSWFMTGIIMESAANGSTRVLRTRRSLVTRACKNSRRDLICGNLVCLTF
jgi:hypothetical protein